MYKIYYGYLKVLKVQSFYSFNTEKYINMITTLIYIFGLEC